MSPMPAVEAIHRLMVSSLSDFLGVSDVTARRLVATLLLIAVYLALRALAGALISRRVDNISRQYLAFKTTSVFLGFLAFLAAFKIWIGGLQGIGSYLGILSAGLAIALQDPLTNIAGWIFIVLRKPFIMGDRIEIANHAGDVISVRLFQFTLVEIRNWVKADQSTGRIIHVPNGWVFKHTLANYTQGFNFVWHEVPIMVTFESNWQRAKEILSDIANRHSALPGEEAMKELRKAARKYLVYYQNLTPIVWTAVADSGVVLTIRYLCNPRRRRSTETSIWEDVLGAFAKCDDVDFAYPTQRFYDNRREGKPAAGGPPGEPPPAQEGAAEEAAPAP